MKIAVVFAGALFLRLAPGAFGQTAQVTGIITDPAGMAVPGAEVVGLNVDTGVKKSVATNELGYYTIPFLNPGNYNVITHKSGFKSIERKGVTLEVAQNARLDLVLQVGDLVESTRSRRAFCATSSVTPFRSID